MGCNFSSKTVNSIERRRNDIIDITNVKEDIQLVRFIKMPSPASGKFDYRSRADDTTQGPVQSWYSVHSNVHALTIRSAHLGNNARAAPQDSNASIIVSDNQLPNGERVFDHRPFLEQNPTAVLTGVTAYGYNYILAIKTVYSVPDQSEPVVILHHGSAFERAKRNEMNEHTLNLEASELIETVCCWWWAETHRIRSLTLGKCNCLTSWVEQELHNLIITKFGLANFINIY